MLQIVTLATIYSYFLFHFNFFKTKSYNQEPQTETIDNNYMFHAYLFNINFIYHFFLCMHTIHKTMQNLNNTTVYK